MIKGNCLFRATSNYDQSLFLTLRSRIILSGTWGFYGVLGLKPSLAFCSTCYITALPCLSFFHAYLVNRFFPLPGTMSHVFTVKKLHTHKKNCTQHNWYYFIINLYLVPPFILS